MLHQDLLVQDSVLIAPRIRVSDRTAAERDEILRVLRRAAVDDGFIAELTHYGPQALRGYHLSLEAQAALLSGDIRWIEARVGKLRPRLRTWLDCRLQQEIW